ncbi:ATP-dependent RNA helicase DEAH12 chloroplastic [Bienertia sinuspersici]
MPLMVALRERVHELVGQLDSFSLKLVPTVEAGSPLQLARVAIGLVTFYEDSHDSLEHCSMCCDEKSPLMMLTLRCSHTFCSQCLKTYANGKVEVGEVPIRCPRTRCNYLISTSECKMFLPVISYDILEKAIQEFNVLGSNKFYCPYPNCLALLDPHQCSNGETSSLDESGEGCIECAVCQRSICMNCGVPWHNSLSCEEYQNLPLDERESSDVSLHRLASDRRWRRCQVCQRMTELAQGCYNMTCWDGQHACARAFWDEDHLEDCVGPTTPEADHWAWNSFDTFPTVLDAYSDQERSQLAIIQRFLASGFNPSDHQSCQLPPPCTDSYIDSMKDLHQLPWLERFVSVISDNYYDDYIPLTHK